MSINMRRWGQFAGGLSGGLDRGLHTGSTLANQALARKGYGDEIAAKAAQRQRDSEMYGDLFGLMTGAITPQEFYQRRAKAFGVQSSPQAPVAPQPLESSVPDTGGYTGPGLGEY